MLVLCGMCVPNWSFLSSVLLLSTLLRVLPGLVEILSNGSEALLKKTLNDYPVPPQNKIVLCIPRHTVSVEADAFSLVRSLLAHTRQCRRSSVSGRFDAALGVGPVVLSGTSTTVPDGAAVSTAGVASTSAATGGAGTRLCDRLHGGPSVEPDAPGALPTGAGGGGGNPLAAPGGPPADDPPCKYSQIA